MKKIIYLIFSVLLIGSFFVAACQQVTPAVLETAPAVATLATEKPAVVAPTTEAPVAPAPSKEKVVLRFLKEADDLDAKAFPLVVDAFQKSEGGKWSYVSIEYNAVPFDELYPTLQKSVATGSPIDLYQADGPDIKNFAYNKVLMDLTDDFTADEMKQWVPQSINDATFQGRFYGPPMVQSCQLMWYNQDYVDAAGLKLGTEGLTYGENGTGLPVWQKLTIDKNGDGVPEVFGVQIASVSGFTDYVNHIAARTNGEPESPTFEGVSEDGLEFVGYFDTPEAIQAFQFDQDLIYKYKVRSAEPPAQVLFSGIDAMVVRQDQILGTLKDQFPDFHMGAMEPPYWKTPMCQTGSYHYGIPVTTEHFTEALAFAKFASSDEGAKIVYQVKAQLPANVNLLNTLPEFQEDGNPRKLEQEFFLKYGKPRLETVLYSEYNTLFREFYPALIAGGDVEALAHQYAKLMDEAAQKYK